MTKQEIHKTKLEMSGNTEKPIYNYLPLTNKDLADMCNAWIDPLSTNKADSFLFVGLVKQLDRIIEIKLTNI